MWFDLQRFGGGKGGSTTTEYEMTPEERRLVNAQADYAEAIQPNARWLNDIARQVLENSLGTIQMDYNVANKNAQERISTALNGLQNLADQNAGTKDYFNQLLLNDVYAPIGKDTDATNAALDAIAQKFGANADETNRALAAIAGQYGTASNKANEVIGALANGIIPTNYQNAMTDSIRSALRNTIGTQLNELARRGVINSSVQTTGLNDISKNAADTVGQMFNTNINQVKDLTQTSLGNTNTALGRQATLTQQQLDNLNTALGQQAQIKQQQFGNSQGLADQRMKALEMYGQNNLNAYTTGNNLYNSLLTGSTAPISTAAAAQEAAQNPALNLWNASIGLNGAGNGTLQAISGRGTTTQTTNPGSGSFWGGLFTAGAAAACFPKNTQVLMADGTKKAIKDIEVGDKVLSASGKPVNVVKLMKPIENYVYEVVAENGIVLTTPTQSFLMADGEWKMLKDFGPCEILKDMGPIIKISYESIRKVYDFETDGENSYVVDGSLGKGGFSVNGGCDELWEKD